MKNQHWTRKEFLKASLVASGAAFVARSRAASTVVGANSDIRLAIVGCGPANRGSGHIKWFGSVPGVRIVALCDVDTENLAGAEKLCLERKHTPKLYTEYRKVLEDSSIDAVTLATPHHWHALQTIWACQAGKDVYVEKPVSHNIWEGRKMVEAARKYNRVVVAGMQSRSDPALHEAFAYIRDGNLGRVQQARGVCYKLRPSIGKTSGPQPLPATVDYDLWVGPSTMGPLRRSKLHYDWHWRWDTGNGDLGNQGVHEVDMCRWALGQPGLPPAVTSLGGRLGYEDDGETANSQIIVLHYEPAPIIFEVRGLPRKAGEQAMDAYRGLRTGISIQCELGYFAGGTSGGWIYDQDGKRVKQIASAGGGPHAANFIKAIRARKSALSNADIEEGHYSSALCHLANISQRLGNPSTGDATMAALQDRPGAKDALQGLLANLEANQVDLQKTPLTLGPKLAFSPESEHFVSRKKFDLGDWANGMLKREYRKPFVIPDVV